MLSNQGILSNKWLLPLMVITIAAMALAFWAMMGNKASAGTPTKNAVAVGDMYLLPDTDADGAAAGWTTILDGAVDTANNHDVVAIMSMECGLHTRTKVKGKQGEEDSATASAGVMVRILINGMEMAPGEVRYCERTQELSARSLAGKPFAWFRATPTRRIAVLHDILVYVIRFTNPLLHL